MGVILLTLGQVSGSPLSTYLINEIVFRSGFLLVVWHALCSARESQRGLVAMKITASAIGELGTSIPINMDYYSYGT